jgi:hypothetical protein
LKKLIIHPGFHKTGTTALQQALSASRHQLEEVNFNYPNTAGNAHHRAAWAIIEKTWGWKKRGGRPPSQVEWKKLARKIKVKGATSIISSEFFAEANLDQLTLLKSKIKDFEVQVIFTWRPLPLLLASSYQQYLQYGIKIGYEEWLASIFEKPGYAPNTPSFWRRNLHGEAVANWCEVFGKGSVSIISVDDSKPNFLFESFSDLTGIPTGVLRSTGEKKINRSLTFNEASLLLKINQNYPTDTTWDSYEIFIRKGGIRALTSSEIVDKDSEKLKTPQWAIDKATEINRKNVAELKALDINIVGDLDRSDFSTVPIGINTPVTNISIETAARAMIGVDMTSLKRMHGRAITEEFFVRLRQIMKQKFRFPR